MEKVLWRIYAKSSKDTGGGIYRGSVLAAGHEEALKFADARFKPLLDEVTVQAEEYPMPTARSFSYLGDATPVPAAPLPNLYGNPGYDLMHDPRW